jgi:hypothetical protein
MPVDEPTFKVTFIFEGITGSTPDVDMYSWKPDLQQLRGGIPTSILQASEFTSCFIILILEVLSFGKRNFLVILFDVPCCRRLFYALDPLRE